MNPVRVLKGRIGRCCCPSVVVVVRRGHFASSINLKIGYVLQIGWNYPKKHFKISQKYFSYGFGGLKSGYFGKIGCFGAKCKIQNGVGGVCGHPKFLFQKFGQFAIQGTHLPNYEFWGAPQRPTTLFYRKTFLVKINSYEQKIAIKGTKFQKTCFPQDFKSMFQMTQEVYTPPNFL